MGDTLLDELKGGDLSKAIPGGKGSIRAIDKQTQANTEGALELTQPPQPTAIAKMNEMHSTRAGGKGFKVTVRGQYFSVAKDGIGKGPIKPYEVVVNLPTLNSAMSVLKNKLLLPALRVKYKDVRTFRTHNIVEAVPLSPATPPSSNIRYATREVLEQFARENRVPIDVKAAAYKNNDALRETLIDYTQNPKGFAEREEKRKVIRAEDAELAALNEGLDLDELSAPQGGDAMPTPATPAK